MGSRRQRRGVARRPVAAAAELADLTILHVDEDFDLIARSVAARTRDALGLEGLRIVQGGDVDAGEVTLPPGRYVRYCAVERRANFLWDLWPVGVLTVVEQP